MIRKRLKGGVGINGIKMKLGMNDFDGFLESYICEWVTHGVWKRH